MLLLVFSLETNMGTWFGFFLFVKKRVELKPMGIAETRASLECSEW